MNAPELVRHFGMSPHPEGGFYRETYRSAGSIPAEALPSAFSGARSYSTAILFLLRQGDVSRLHRIRQDELWHFYLGDPLRLVMISPEGRPEEVVLGQDVTRGAPAMGRSRRVLVRGGFGSGIGVQSGRLHGCAGIRLCGL